jgi:hypothetical protein
MSDQRVQLTCKNWGKAFSVFLTEMAEHNSKITPPGCGKVYKRLAHKDSE